MAYSVGFQRGSDDYSFVTIIYQITSTRWYESTKAYGRMAQLVEHINGVTCLNPIATNYNPSSERWRDFLVLNQLLCYHWNRSTRLLSALRKKVVDLIRFIGTLIALILLCSTFAYAEDISQVPSIIVEANQEEVDPGDTIVFTYIKQSEDIHILGAQFIYQEGGTSEDYYDLEDSSSGSISCIAKGNGLCWLEITYQDDSGTMYLAKSNPISVRSYQIDINITGVNDDGEIEAGDTLTLTYEVTGGKPGFSVNFYWCIDLGGTFSIDTETMTSSERIGSFTYVPTDQTKHVGYYIDIYFGGERCLYIWELSSVKILYEHDWHDPTYHWATNKNSLTAIRICKNNEDHIEYETVPLTCDIISPTFTQQGYVTYTSSKFSNVAFETQAKTIIIPRLGSLNILSIPSMTIMIDESAFEGVNCQAVIIPNGCTTLGKRCFANCANLVYVHIPTSVTHIAEDAFENCEQVIIDRDE